MIRAALMQGGFLLSPLPRSRIGAIDDSCQRRLKDGFVP
ncbi:hypothetical protein B8V81_3380 [Paenibacillus pasadenensis]|uniref:Uncharacterized protein n=1 Tax=Paenibacillus pasadenensis TaxID=217090 RepID=A0A2N5N3T6_9BACL|nr:hypothetical protein B8V81_3380 [Paenibacillus pasadenensis]